MAGPCTSRGSVAALRSHACSLGLNFSSSRPACVSTAAASGRPARNFDVSARCRRQTVAESWPMMPSRQHLQQRRLYSSSDNIGNEMVRYVADCASEPLSKYKLKELIDLRKMGRGERHKIVERGLHIAISKIVILLLDMPLGFGSTDALRSVINGYIGDLKKLRACSSDDLGAFRKCISEVSVRHRGIMGEIAMAIDQFRSQIGDGYLGHTEDGIIDLASISETVPAMQRIERALDEFFTMRTTLRLLIGHCGDSEDVDDVIRLTSPSLILTEAFMHAQMRCRTEAQLAAPLIVNGVPANEFLAHAAGNSSLEERFPYADIHLYFVFYEVLMNALRATANKARRGGKPRAVHVSLMAGSSMEHENGRVVKITDDGEGIKRENVGKVWSYFYSTVLNSPEDGDSASNRSTTDGRVVHGLGLPVSRVLIRYFGGDVDLHSVRTKGTDVYIYV